MLRAFIVDDEPPARARLRQLLAEAGDVLVVGEAGDADRSARPPSPTSVPTSCFSTSRCRRSRGTALAGSLPEPRPFIVFATAFDRYALDAFARGRHRLSAQADHPRAARRHAGARARAARRADPISSASCVAASAAQALLLPRTLPAMAGYDAAAVTLPARGVGGDFFSASRSAPTGVVFALGDVSGKGMPAGLVASSLQARLETVARHGGGDRRRRRRRRQSGAVRDDRSRAIRDARLLELDAATPSR